MNAAIHWPSTISYTVDATLNFTDAAITAAFETWQSVLPYTFHRVALGGQFVVAPLTDVLAAFHLEWEPIAVNVTVWDPAAGTGTASYVGLDLHRALASGWEPWVVVLHEIGHAFGLTDRPSSTGPESLYGYAEPHATGLTADAVEFVQSRIGTSFRSDLIVLTGTAGGAVRGGFGADTISGCAGAEIIYGNQGEDVLLAGFGDDTVFGGQEGDLIRGGEGQDVIYGNLGSDTLSGGPGADRLYGGQQEDVIHAGPDDTVWGGLGADTIWAHPLAVIGQHDPADTIIVWGV